MMNRQFRKESRLPHNLQPKNNLNPDKIQATTNPDLAGNPVLADRLATRFQE
tara:strand:+ start:127 stop:282 length:156 start_codon:yes stop_codon:yes gene_type:complete